MSVAITDRFSHPVLVAMAAIGILFLVAGFVTDALGLPSLAGFFAMYSAVAFLLSGIGYASVVLIKNVSKSMQRRSSSRN